MHLASIKFLILMTVTAIYILPVRLTFSERHRHDSQPDRPDEVPRSATSFSMSIQRLPWSSTQVSGFKPGRIRQEFSGRKNPQHAFLRSGSKAVGPMS